MVLFHAKYAEDENDRGLNGYLVTSPDKKMPQYFQPTVSARGVAHDIVDHLTHNPNLHPVLDEFVAIGVAYYREDDVDVLKADVENLLIEFRERELYDAYQDEDEYADDIKFMTYNIFRIHYTPSIDLLIDDELGDILDKMKYVEDWVEPHRKHIQQQVAKALTKGYRLANRIYTHPLNASEIHHTITDYVEKVLPKRNTFGYTYSTVDEYSPILRFDVSRDTGKVKCQQRSPYEGRYY